MSQRPVREIVDDLGAAVRDADGGEAHLGPLGGRRGGAAEALGGKVLHAEEGAGRAEAGRLQEVASGKGFHKFQCYVLHKNKQILRISSYICVSNPVIICIIRV